jgi:hypothetical protein
MINSSTTAERLAEQAAAARSPELSGLAAEAPPTQAPVPTASNESAPPGQAQSRTVEADGIAPIDPARLTLSPGDVAHQPAPAIVANAYSNNLDGATESVQYVLDHQQNSLATLANNEGTLVTIGTVTLDGRTLDFSARAGLDIQTTADGTDTAYALLNVDGRSGLYTINLETAEASQVGSFDAGLGTLKSLAVSDGKGITLADDGRTLVRFDLHDPSEVTTVAIGGDGDKLDAIDVRPATGELFGYDDATDTYFIVDAHTGLLTIASIDATPTSTDAVSIDWNPTIDRMRTVSEDDENIVYNPETETASDEATVPLFYAIGEPTNVFTPGIVANAYTNNLDGATASVQFVLDHQYNSLATLANNEGTLMTVGTVTLDGRTLDFTADAGFDVLTDQDGTNTAFALLNVDGSSGLYTIDLETAEATHLGSFDAHLGTLTSLAVTDDKGMALADDGRTLVRFDLHDPTSTTTVALDGDGERLDAIDVRPATGELFGYDDTTDSYFVVDAHTGMLTTASVEATPTTTGVLDIDWNPTIDRMRTVTEADENIVYNPETGTASDAATAPLFYELPDATITFKDATAETDDTLGAFLIGADGTIGAVRGVFASTSPADGMAGDDALMRGDSMALSDLFAPQDLMAEGRIGLFLLEDGAARNDMGLIEGESLGFIDASSGETASLATSPENLILVDTASGDALSGRVIHALAELNAQGDVLALGEIDPVSGALHVAFETGDDMAFDDLQIAFDNGTGPDEGSSADGSGAMAGEPTVSAGELASLVAEPEAAIV